MFGCVNMFNVEWVDVYVVGSVGLFAAERVALIMVERINWHIYG